MPGKTPATTLKSDDMPTEPSTTGSEETHELDDGFEPVSLDDEGHEPDVVDAAELVDTHHAPPPPTAPQRRGTFSLPELEAVTPQDREFIQRVFVQVRDVDFRSPPPPPPKKDLAGPDKKIALLRQKIHELERDLARVGFVWNALQAQYENVEKIVASKEGERVAAVDRHNLLRDQATRAAAQHKSESDSLKHQVSTLSEQKAVVEIELAKTRAVAERDAHEATNKLTKSEQEKAALMADFRAKMEMAQTAFTQLREQSMRAVSDLEARLAKRDEEYAGKQRELEGAQLEVQALKGNVADLQTQVSERDTKLTSAAEEKDRIVARLAERDKTFNMLAEEMQKTRTQHDEYVQELRASVKSREELLDAARAEVASARDEFRQLGDAHEARKRELSEREEQLKTVRGDFDSLKGQAQKLEQDLGAREGELTAAKAGLEAAREEARLAREDVQRLGAQLAEAQAAAPAKSTTDDSGIKSASGEGKDV